MGDFNRPSVEINVKDSALDIYSGQKGLYVTYVHVQKTVGCEASVCSVRIKSDGSGVKDYNPKFMSSLKFGAKIEVKLGYSKKPKTVFIGYITATDFEVAPNGEIIVVLTCMDGKVLMMSNRKSQLMKDKKKYSDGVSEVFKNYTGKFSGKNINISNEPELNIPIYQYRESDYEFVCRMAYLTGALFFIDNGKFNFVDMYSGNSSNTVFDKNIVSGIKKSFNLFGVPKKVETVAQNSKDYTQVIKGEATNSKPIGSGKTATAICNNIDSVLQIVDGSVSSNQDAKRISEIEQNRRSFNFVSIIVKLMNGKSDLELGKIYKVKDKGKLLDNDFMLSGVEHHMFGDKYETYARLNSTRCVEA